MERRLFLKNLGALLAAASIPIGREIEEELALIKEAPVESIPMSGNYIVLRYKDEVLQIPVLSMSINMYGGMEDVGAKNGWVSRVAGLSSWEVDAEFFGDFTIGKALGYFLSSGIRIEFVFYGEGKMSHHGEGYISQYRYSLNTDGFYSGYFTVTGSGELISTVL